MRTLRETKGKKALEYLKEVRGLSDRIIDVFQIGYCPIRTDHELAGRIIIPICDPYGNPVAISTRHPEKRRDFWHESFNKSFYLYGLHIAKRYIISRQKAIIVEGEFDVTCLHSMGLKATVGVCGSAFSPFQASLLARYCNEVYLVFDADENKSGEKAIKRALKMQRDRLHGMRFIPVRLPVGTDPDDFIKKQGRKSFVSLLNESKNKKFNSN